MNKLDKFFNKNQNTLIGIVLIAILGWSIGKFLDWTSANSSGFLKVLKFKVEVPLFALILSAVIVWFSFYLFRTCTINRRGLKIVGALYGADNSFVDITSELNSKVIEDHLKVVINNSIAGDPTAGIVKHAEVKYQYKNKVTTVSVSENQTLDIP